MSRANFQPIAFDSDSVTIKDLGPWDKYPTITNDADAVVRCMVNGYMGVKLNGRRLFYIDSEDQRDEILIEDGAFAGFHCGAPRSPLSLNPEADEVDPQDLEAAADMYDRLKEAATHNPAPWKWESSTKTIRTEKENYWLASLNSWDGMVTPHNEANGAFIVQAVNSHADLVKALEGMLEVQSKRRHPLGAPDEGIAYMAAQAAANARDAIAKAKGGKVP